MKADSLPRVGPDTDRDGAVESLYQAHAAGLIRLAYVMLGDRAGAEDVVQDAFAGLYRHWHRLDEAAKALVYVRSAVLNGCRSAVRRRKRHDDRLATYRFEPPAASAEASALSGEERREVVQALRRLPGRQREALVLRYYLDLPDEQIAEIMKIGPSTVRSTLHRALKALGETLKETP
jgi:RNA polymerase sigma-70 factor (sigma-E family)